MGRLIKPVLMGGPVQGDCPKCRGPYLGYIKYSDLVSQPKRIEVPLECDTCGHQGNYFVSIDDGMPAISLRHASNGRKLGERPKKGKKKKKNPDQVLKGQFAFDIPKDHGIIQ